MKSLTLTGLIVLSSLTLASCTSTTTKNTPAITTPKPSQTAPKKESTTATSSTMTHSTSTTTTEAHMGATSEEEFIVNMIPHHQEAIDNAKIIIAKSENIELKKIAQVIVDDQSKEVVTLKGWFKNWYPNSTMKKEYMSMMDDLNKLSSHDLDDAFMESMVKHHE